MTADFILGRWDYADAAERRYKRVMRVVIGLYLIFGVLIPLLKLVGVQEGGGDSGKQRYAKLVQAQPAPIAPKAEEPPPAPEPTPEPPKQQPKPKEVKPEPTVEQQQQHARQVAQRSGLMAMADQLADLRDRNITSVEGSRPLTSAAPATGGASTADSQMFAASASQSSGGIASSTNGAGRRQSGTQLDQRKTTTVQSPVGFGKDQTKPGQGGDKLIAGRTLEEIQLAFDRTKSAFYQIFDRAARSNPNISTGKIVVSLTIAPDGSVTDCHVVSSTFGDPELEGKVVARVKLINFGAKDVPVFTYPNYPINYLPS